MWNDGNQGYGNQGYGNQNYNNNRGYGNPDNGNSGYFPPPPGPPPPQGPGGFSFPTPEAYPGGPPPPMAPRPDGMSPGYYGAPPSSSPYGSSPGSGTRAFPGSGSGGGFGGLGGGLLNSAVSKVAARAGLTPLSANPPSGYSPPAGPPPGQYSSNNNSNNNYREYNSGPTPNSIYNNFSGPTSGPPPPQHGGRQGSFPYQQPGETHMPPSQAQYYGPQTATPGGGQEQPSFMYSQCTGKKKALIIGINYFGTDQELGGCINDATKMRAFIRQNYGYRDDDIVVLTDDARNPVQQPTKANILRAMEWLVRGAQPNDSLFFHYSGHGGLTKDTNGDEEDGWDEVIYPSDYKDTEHIVDDEMHDIMVRPLPAGCRLTAIFDSCHSGSALDLPYIYSTEGTIKEPNLYAQAGSSLMGAATSYMKKDYGGVFKGITGLAKAVSGSGSRADELTRRTKGSQADVISWSGCKDSQTSADTQVAGQGTGAMSWAFTEALTENPRQSYQQLLISIRAKLRAKYSQKPQLSSSHPMDTNIVFII